MKPTEEQKISDDQKKSTDQKRATPTPPQKSRNAKVEDETNDAPSNPYRDLEMGDDENDVDEDTQH